jgi:Arc/MetJ family transcription regulator
MALLASRPLARQLRLHDNTHSEVYTVMRTNIVLDDRLVEEAMRSSGALTKREVVDLALRELVARRRQKNLKHMVGRDLIDPKYDVRAVRRTVPRGSG